MHLLLVENTAYLVCLAQTSVWLKFYMQNSKYRQCTVGLTILNTSKGIEYCHIIEPLLFNKRDTARLAVSARTGKDCLIKMCVICLLNANVRLQVMLALLAFLQIISTVLSFSVAPTQCAEIEGLS